MLNFLDLLERFNRKERFFLVLNAIGQERLTLSAEFRKKLGDEVGVTVPDDAYAAMDYHLDWLAASVRAYSDGLTEEELLAKVFPNHGKDKVVTGTIEDIDLLVAFKAKFNKKNVFHVVLIEAKGDDEWDAKQLESKTERLGRIFTRLDKDGRESVKPHFCLTSPDMHSLPTGETIKHWLEWMRRDSEPFWIPLSFPDNRLVVTRPDQDGNSFTIVQTGGGTPQDTNDKRREKNNPDRLTRTGQPDRRYRENR